MKWVLRLLINSVLGFIVLFLYNFIGAYWGLSLGLNIFNAVVIGLFGVPGFALLLILKALVYI